MNLERIIKPVNSSRVWLDRNAADAGASVPAGARVLDAGAGEAPYARHFAHAAYETCDFAQVDKPYALNLDYVCDLTDLPMSNATYDLVFCSQVLEHCPEPIAVLREIRRVLKPGGRAWLSAPLFYPEHEQPYDFHRYTQFAWRRMADEAGFTVQTLDWLEGYYGTLSFQLRSAGNALSARWIPLRILFLLLARMFGLMDVKHRITDRGMPKNYRCVMIAM